ncbi:MAG: NRAMP family divalent metal transporter [Hyphomicrobiaceae bacterium]
MNRKRKVRWGRFLGPGLIAGASDDDPSGIATYSQAGAQFGFAMLWTVVFTWPFMVAIQLIAAHIGRVTGAGIMGNIKTIYPRWIVMALTSLLVIANTINIAADLAAMGEALKLVVGGGQHGHALVFGVVCIVLQIFIPYRQYAPILRWLTLSLLAYVATAFTVKVPWAEALRQTLWPSLQWSADYLLVVVAVFGTTISPYVFFWQASQEVEEMHQSRPHRPLKDLKRGGNSELVRMEWDTLIGMAASNIVAFFIILTTAATLHAAGLTNIATSAQAAEALRPLAGELTFLLFALGIIGTGLLAVPVLAASAAYAVGETFGLRSTLEAKPGEAKGFYGVILAATLIGVMIDFTSLDPIKMLFWSAVINGVIAIPIMAVMMLLVTNKRVMGRFTASPLLAIGGWAATAAMLAVVTALLWTIR